MAYDTLRHRQYSPSYRGALAALPLILATKRIESTDVRFINIFVDKELKDLVPLDLDSSPVRLALHFIAADVSLILHKYLSWSSVKSKPRYRRNWFRSSHHCVTGTFQP